MKFDLDKCRADFPVLEQDIHGYPLVYLDNAATTQKPRQVIEAISQFYLHDNSNVHRGVHALAERATSQYEAARKKVQRFINAPHAEDCVWVRGTTEAINLVAHSYLMPRLKPGDQILISALEHHSNIVPWHLICKKTGAEIRVIPIHDNGELDLAAFAEMLVPPVKFIALAHISNALGSINPIQTMIKMAHDHGIKVLIDGAQGAPHLPIDVQALDCDFYAFSSHKMFGPTGIGVLYGKSELLNEMEPYQGGGDMITEVHYQYSEYQKPPLRFEAGTQDIAGVIGLGSAIDYLSAMDKTAVAAHEHELLLYATSAIQTVSGYRIVGTATHKASIISFVHDTIHSHDLATVLNSFGVAVRAGHHCAMPLMERLGLTATTRASFSFYNTASEVDRLVDALERAKEVFL